MIIKRSSNLKILSVGHPCISIDAATRAASYAGGLKGCQAVDL